MVRTFLLLSLLAVLAPTALHANEPVKYKLYVIHLKADFPFEIGEAEDGLHDAERLIRESQEAKLLEQVSSIWMSGSLGEKLMVQLGETVPVVVGQTRFPSGGRSTGDRPPIATQTNYQQERTGTLLQCVGRREGEDLLVDLEFEQTRLAAPNQDESGVNVAPKGTTSLQTTLRLKSGETAVVGNYKTSDDKEHRAMIILLTAECTCPDDTPAPPAPVEKGTLKTN